MMKRIMGIIIMVLCIVPLNEVLAAGDPNDMAGSKDPALFSRMPGFHIYNYEELEFNRYDFPFAAGKTQAVEGHHVYVDYYINEGAKVPSGLQIARNYENAAKAIGGKTVYEFEDGGVYYVTLKVVKGNAEAWVQVQAAGNGMYKINVIEKQTMTQAVSANAESLAGSIRESGKAAVYGIYFDTGKSVIKEESEPAISEIVKLLNAEPKLRLYVVGHTDNVGAFDYNIKLSQARAAAVVSALINKHGIAASRLIPFGAGPTSPVESNQTEEGRAKNRRVELVAQ
ncbi:MAG TPA: OmpA family protein [Thermodesulfovibrionales bacterium]|nr:OmpA family protein [Thermodesulfovibrionales bacterium]